MEVSDLNTSLNSSTSSQLSQLKIVEDAEMLKIRDYVKSLLRSRIFLGRYLERRLADQRVGYRDIVKLSLAEVELKRDLLEAQCKLQSIFANTHWIGISCSEAAGHSSICLWTEIDSQPFGVFWFQIKSVKFRDHEVIITLKCIRHITDAFMEVEPIILGCVEKPSIEAKVNDAANEIFLTIKNAFTLNSIIEFVTFIFAFIIAIFTGSNTFVQFLGNFVLALVREMSNLISKSTPLILGCLDFFSKIVGGFYILIAMIFKPSYPNPMYKRTVAHYDRHQHRYDRNFD